MEVSVLFGFQNYNQMTQYFINNSHTIFQWAEIIYTSDFYLHKFIIIYVESKLTYQNILLQRFIYFIYNVALFAKNQIKLTIIPLKSEALNL